MIYLKVFQQFVKGLKVLKVFLSKTVMTDLINERECYSSAFSLTRFLKINTLLWIKLYKLHVGCERETVQK